MKNLFIEKVNELNWNVFVDVKIRSIIADWINKQKIVNFVNVLDRETIEVRISPRAELEEIQEFEIALTQKVEMEIESRSIVVPLNEQK